MKFRLIDLFCGCGGMTLGFTHPGYCGKFTSVFAIDNDPAAIESYQANFGNHAICADIEAWIDDGRTIPTADIVIGGPPCQGFSLLNKNRCGDGRRALWLPFMDFVAASEASVFVIENVQGLLRSPECDAICSRAQEMGFACICDLLNSADYGTPQTRKRAFIVGWKKDIGSVFSFPPPPAFAAPNAGGSLPPWRSVHDAISDLKEPAEYDIRNIAPPYDLHFRRNPTPISLERYKAVPPGGNRFDLQKNRPDITPQCWINKVSGGTDLFGRLWWDRPSVTIRTEFFKPEKGRYLHPEQHRPITHREAARLMGFPDNFRFKGNKTDIARQIGNAVPPHLAGAVAKSVMNYLKTTLQKVA